MKEESNRRVFVFCIGGTGLRVMKSIVMLLAAGYSTKGYTLIPILIDPHQDLTEKTELDKLIDDYRKIYNKVTDHDAQPSLEGFFGTKLQRLEELDALQNPTNENSMADQRPFTEYLDLVPMDKQDINQFLVQTLYSEHNLNSKLSVGFKGNPNVGTVVLNDMIGSSDWFEGVQRHCEKNDRIFIIGSIFGGTGASGYPLLEKKIRDSIGYPKLQKAVMGAVAVLPYFALNDPATTGSDIDSANFVTKAKAALGYYEHTVKSDYLYYIGESELRESYQNDEIKQDNPAHFIELVAATALFHFLELDRPETTQYYSRAIRENKTVIDLPSAGDSYSGVVKALTDMKLLTELTEFIQGERSFPLKITHGLTEDFYTDADYAQLLKGMLDRFAAWYKQLSHNNRAFNPLNMECNKMKQPVTGISIHASRPQYVLEMIKKAYNASKDEQSLQLPMRHLLNYAYQAIDTYTRTLLK